MIRKTVDFERFRELLDRNQLDNLRAHRGNDVVWLLGGHWVRRGEPTTEFIQKMERYADGIASGRTPEGLTTGNLFPIIRSTLEGAMKILTRPKEAASAVLGDAFWVGTNLHRLRREKGLTQEALAAAAGLTARRLRDIENAALESNILLETLSALAKALGVKTELLFKRHKDVEALASRI